MNVFYIHIIHSNMYRKGRFVVYGVKYIDVIYMRYLHMYNLQG